MSSSEINKNIKNIYNQRIEGLYSLCVLYSGYALNIIRSRQTGNYYWNNQTWNALKGIFSNAFVVGSGSVMGLYVAHTVSYGVYLELTRNRQNSILWPVISEIWPSMKADIEKLFGAVK